MYEFFTESKEKLKTWISEKIAAQTDPGARTNDQPFQGLSFNRYSLSSKCMPGTTPDPVQTCCLSFRGRERGESSKPLLKKKCWKQVFTLEWAGEKRVWVNIQKC